MKDDIFHLVAADLIDRLSSGHLEDNLEIDFCVGMSEVYLGSQAGEDALATYLKERFGNKNPDAVALGRLGGLKGGKARAAKLSPSERSAAAQKAAEARWSERSTGDQPISHRRNPSPVITEKMAHFHKCPECGDTTSGTGESLCPECVNKR